MATAAVTARRAEIAQLPLDVGVRTRRLAPHHRVDHAEHARAFRLAQSSRAIGIVAHRFSNHLALGLVQTLGRMSQTRHRRIVERKGDFYHT